MIIKKISCKNLKCFAHKEVTLDKVTFFKGDNGAGKTTITLDAILFALYGFTFKDKLSDLPTRNKSKSCSVTIELENKSDSYIITRHYPSKLEITANGKKLNLSISAGQNYINERFGTRELFMRFRLVDAYSKDINFLEQGQVTLKRILFANSEDFINKVRDKLKAIKRNRTIYNRDNIGFNYHYPSKKRQLVIKLELSNFGRKGLELEKLQRSQQQESLNIQRELRIIKDKKNELEVTKQFAEESEVCYVCGQELSKKLQKDMVEKLEAEWEDLKDKSPEYEAEMELIESKVSGYTKEVRKIRDRVLKLNLLKQKLEDTFKLNEYKYTDKDVLIADKAIKELDNLSSYCLKENIRVLEPIINSVLEKIDFKIKFIISDKGKFTITLQKDEIVYGYKDLSTGEKLIVQIAFKLALMMEQSQYGLLLADEGMSALDSTNLLHILKIFANYPYQLVIILHRMEEEIENTKTINLIKTNRP